MTQPRVTPLQGGLNLSGLTIGLKAGEATLLENYECLPEGGYRRFDGFERYDGRPEPHKATYRTLAFDSGVPAGVAPGETVVGSDAGAAGRVLAVRVDTGSFATGDAAGVIVIDNQGDTPAWATADEYLLVGGVIRATKRGAMVEESVLNPEHDDWRILAADARRLPILPVPGSGAVRGVAVYKGRVQAWRNAEDGATCVMHESSPAGWTPKKTGLAPDGRYECIVHNFMGAASERKLYGVSGTHKAFEWDGTTWTDITTGMTVDTPKHLAEHVNYLWLAFDNGSLQNSPVGDPTAEWTLRTGAAEFGIGAEITALHKQRGGVLAIYCDNAIKLLYGSSVEDWLLKTHSDNTGAYAGTVQETPGGVTGLDERGLTPLAATDAFGDFKSATVSQRVQKLLDTRRGHAAASMVVRRKSLYRVFFDDGTVLSACYAGSKIIGYAMLRLPILPTCAASGEDEDGAEMLVIGAADGNVYRLDVGMSFDGLPVEALIRIAPDHCGSPRHDKHFQKLLLQVDAPRRVNLLAQPEFDYQAAQADISQYLSAQPASSSNLWDVGSWDEMRWDSGDERGGIAYPEVAIDGVALTMGVMLYHGGEIRPPFTLEAAIVHYNPLGFRT